MQTHKQSLIEAMVNVASGMIIAFLTTQALAPFLGIGMPVGANIILTCILTVVSVLRGYCWRRFFNKRHGRPDKELDLETLCKATWDEWTQEKEADDND